MEHFVLGVVTAWNTLCWELLQHGTRCTGSCFGCNWRCTKTNTAEVARKLTLTSQVVWNLETGHSVFMTCAN